MAFRALAAGCFAALAAVNFAFAQSDNNALRDPDRMQAIREDTSRKLEEQLTGFLAQLRGGGVIFDVHYRCGTPQVQVARIVKNEVAARTNIPTSSWFFSKQDPYRLRIAMLPPGDYEVLGLICKEGNNTNLFSGPFAKFQVKLGEVVNIGALKLDYQSKDILFGSRGAMKKSIESLTPEAIADLKQKYPTVFPKAVERRMEMIGAAEVEMKPRPRSILTGQPCPPGTAIC